MDEFYPLESSSIPSSLTDWKNSFDMTYQVLWYSFFDLFCCLKSQPLVCVWSLGWAVGWPWCGGQKTWVSHIIH